MARPKRILALWIRHLALCAMGEARAATLVTKAVVNKSGAPRGACVQAFRPLERDAARALLSDLAHGFRVGQVRPLPFLPPASLAYFVARKAPDARGKLKNASEALATAVAQYEPEPGEPGYDAHAALAFDRRVPPFDARYEQREIALETTEFHALAEGVFAPLLAHLSEGKA
jgi:exonuclease V gamma subunit